MKMKAEPLLAELNRLRQEVPDDPQDIEYLTMQHVFRFVSYKMGDFQKYVAEADERGEFNDYKNG